MKKAVILFNLGGPDKLESVDTSHEHPVTHDHTKPLVNEKEIELLKVQIEEIKVSTSTPLAN